MKLYLKCFLAAIFLSLASLSFAQDFSPFTVEPDKQEVEDAELRQLDVPGSKIPENRLDAFTLEMILMSLEDDPAAITDRVSLSGGEVDSLRSELSAFREVLRDGVNASLAVMCEAYNGGATAKEAWLAYDAAQNASFDGIRDEAFVRMGVVDSLIVNENSKAQFASYYAQARDVLSKATTVSSHSAFQQAMGDGQQEKSAEYHCNR